MVELRLLKSARRTGVLLAVLFSLPARAEILVPDSGEVEGSEMKRTSVSSDDGEASAALQHESPEVPAKESQSEKTSVHAPFPEERDDWTQWPVDTSVTPLRADFPPTRWASFGGFVGWVHRPSGSDEINYRPGVAYGGYVRPQIASWLSARLFYRQESIPVEVASGAYDFGGKSTGLDFEQPNLEVVNLGIQLEPIWVVHPRFRVHGILGWSWLGFRALMPTASGFNEEVEGKGAVRGERSGVETNFTFGAGGTVDIISNWLELGVSASYSLVAAQTGSAYDTPLQVIVDGQIAYLAPLPKFKNSTDIIFSLGLIL